MYDIFFGHIFLNQNIYCLRFNKIIRKTFKKENIFSDDILWKCWHFLSDHLCEWHPILNSNFGTCKGWASNIYHHSYWRSANLIFSKLLSEYFARQTPSKIQPPNLGLVERNWEKEKSRGVNFNQGSGRFVKEGLGQKPNLGSSFWPSIGDHHSTFLRYKVIAKMLHREQMLQHFILLIQTLLSAFDVDLEVVLKVRTNWWKLYFLFQRRERYHRRWPLTHLCSINSLLYFIFAEKSAWIKVYGWKDTNHANNFRRTRKKNNHKNRQFQKYSKCSPI